MSINDHETFKNGHTYDNETELPGIHITNSIFDNAVNFVTDTKGEEPLADWVLNKMDLDVFFLFGNESARYGQVTFHTNMSAESTMGPLNLNEGLSKFFDKVNYIGALNPNGEDWRSCWAINLDGTKVTGDGCE